MMKFFTPLTTLAVGAALGYFVVPKIINKIGVGA